LLIEGRNTPAAPVFNQQSTIENQQLVYFCAFGPAALTSGDASKFSKFL